MRDDKELFQNKPSSSGELLSELGSIKQLLDEELEQSRIATAIEEIGSVEEYLRLKQAAAEAGLSIDAYLAQQEGEAPSSPELELLEEDDETPPVLDEVIPLDEEEPQQTAPDGDALLMELAEEEEQHVPSTAEATTVEEYFAAVAAAKHRAPGTLPPPTAKAASLLAAAPLHEEAVEEVEVNEEPSLLDEVNAFDAIPTLEEVVDEPDAIPVLDEVAGGAASAAADAGMNLDEMQELVDLIVNRKLQQLRPELEKEVMSELQRLLPLSSLDHT